MNNRQLKWKIGSNDLKSATIILEYHGVNGNASDIIAVPIGNMKPSTLVKLSSCEPRDLYRVLFESDAIIYAPVSMSTLMTSNYDDIKWDEEHNKVNDTSSGSITRVSLSIMRGNDNVFTMEFPSPTNEDIQRLLDE
jgi:hypothetical protein